MNVAILGKQASGKGTQAELLAEEFDFFEVHVGRILKEAAKKDSEIDRIVNIEGELVPDETAFSYTTDYIEKNNKEGRDILFDGYPRSVEQYELLKEWLEKKGQKLNFVIWLDISDKTAIKRISARRVCSKCGEIYNLLTNPPPSEEKCSCGGKLVQRKDDKKEAVKKRLAWSRETRAPLLDVFKRDGILIEVDGERPIKVIFEDIVKKLKEKNEEN